MIYPSWPEVPITLPFIRNGICPSRLVAHRKPGAQLKMAQLSAIGANRSGFSLLFSSRLYAMFVRPKLEARSKPVSATDRWWPQDLVDSCASAHYQSAFDAFPC
ncbi:hypothetical protein G6F47_013693 [Rhizopus delemar]|nr:hypothetical protein G6F47_013693 [Rhizopus delemar]